MMETSYGFYGIRSITSHYFTVRSLLSADKFVIVIVRLNQRIHLISDFSLMIL